MEINKIRSMLDTAPEYQFLRNLDGVALLTLGGSHAYGTENEHSDVDVRGMAVNSRREILLGEDFAQVVDVKTDTTIYSFRKLTDLLIKCNPNTIELLGCRKEHYFKVTEVGKLLLDHTPLFLSQRCIHTFGSYATAQLRRLENKSIRVQEQAKREQHVLNTIKDAESIFRERYQVNGVRIYIDRSDQPELDQELYADIHTSHVPLRQINGFLGEVTGIIRSYDRTGSRNSKAIGHDKLGKHMMHLLRLYIMCIDILEKEQVITYREAEHDLLMDIRNGKYLDADRQPRPEFYELLNEYEKRFEYAKKNTSLKEEPDHKRIDELRMYVNEKIVKGEM